VAVDTPGLLLTIVVTSAVASDPEGAKAVAKQLNQTDYPRLQKIRARAMNGRRHQAKGWFMGMVYVSSIYLCTPYCGKKKTEKKKNNNGINSGYPHGYT
jgi:hypothetical protein